MDYGRGLRYSIINSSFLEISKEPRISHFYLNNGFSFHINSDFDETLHGTSLGVRRIPVFSPFSP